MLSVRGSSLNYFISGIIRIMLLEASLALLIFEPFATPSYNRLKENAAAIIAAAIGAAWLNYGLLHGNANPAYVATALPLALVCRWLVSAAWSPAPSPRVRRIQALAPRVSRKVIAAFSCAALVAGWIGIGIAARTIPLQHPWEQLHFYFGAKYQREIGSFNLYPALILADRESVRALDGVTEVRDTETFEMVPIATALKREPEIRARFSAARWQEFRADWATFARTFHEDWRRALGDHGNSNSPAWSLVANPLTHLVPISEPGVWTLAWLDVVLVFGLWLVVWQVFGNFPAAIGFSVAFAMPNTFDYLAGSLLRWDWLAATALAACALATNRYRTAGALWGYAVASKLFPLFFGFALVIWGVFAWRKSRTVDARLVRFFAAAAVTLIALVATAAIIFGAEAWPEYARRIHAAQLEKFYPSQYSLKTVFLQWAAGDWSLIAQGPFPSTLAQSLDSVHLRDHRVGLLVAQFIFTVLIAQLVRRATLVEAFLLGPLFVFTWLTVNMYYWNMMGLLALGLVLRREAEPAARWLLYGIIASLCFFFVYQHTNRGFTQGFAVAEVWAALIIIAGFQAFKTNRVSRARISAPLPKKV